MLARHASLINADRIQASLAQARAQTRWDARERFSDGSSIGLARRCRGRLRRRRWCPRSSATAMKHGASRWSDRAATKAMSGEGKVWTKTGRDERMEMAADGHKWAAASCDGPTGQQRRVDDTDHTGRPDTAAGAPAASSSVATLMMNGGRREDACDDNKNTCRSRPPTPNKRAWLLGTSVLPARHSAVVVSSVWRLLAWRHRKTLLGEFRSPGGSLLDSIHFCTQ